MKKKSFDYSNLSKKGLEHLKELYIQKKVDGMSHKELKSFVSEIITHQIKNTIGKEEEEEAWEEISSFFGDQFEIIIQEIQKEFDSYENHQNNIDDDQIQRIKLLEKNNIDNEKKDMWDD